MKPKRKMLNAAHMIEARSLQQRLLFFNRYLFHHKRQHHRKNAEQLNARWTMIVIIVDALAAQCMFVSSVANLSFIVLRNKRFCAGDTKLFFFLLVRLFAHFQNAIRTQKSFSLHAHTANVRSPTHPIGGIDVIFCLLADNLKYVNVHLDSIHSILINDGWLWEFFAKATERAHCIVRANAMWTDLGDYKCNRFGIDMLFFFHSARCQCCCCFFCHCVISRMEKSNF